MRYYVMNDGRETSHYTLNKVNGSPVNLTEASFLDVANLELPIFFSAGCASKFNIKIGAFSSINSFLSTYVSEVGRYSFIGRNVSFLLGVENFPRVEKVLSNYFLVNPAFFDDADILSSTKTFGLNKKLLFSPILIGNGVFVSDDVKIAPGVKIGNGALIYSGASVDRDIEPYEILTPEVTDKPQYRFQKATRDILEEVSLWDYNLVSELNLDFFSESGLIYLATKIKQGMIEKLKPVNFLLKNEGNSHDI